MNEFIKILIGILILLGGFPIGNYLVKKTKDELKSGQALFKLIIIVSLIGGFIGFVVGNDVLMFSLFFIGIVTSRSLIK